jgi:hypothetical protein
VPVDRRNQTLQLACLEAKVKALEGGCRPKVIQAQATKCVSEVVIWGAVDGHINGTDGVIRNLDGGLYEIIATLSYVAGHNQVVQLLKGTECIHTAYCVYSSGHAGSSIVTTIARIETGEQLYFKCTANFSGYHTSYLTLVRMGN